MCALLKSCESLKIQAGSAVVEQKRVKSNNLLLEAGRARILNLLEAKESLVLAQNSLTSAVISYRMAKLELQPDTGLHQVDKSGLW